jgi:DNA polymerase III sliding clamp (beta) subunit (PCNA family)
VKLKINVGELVEALSQASITTDRMSNMPIGNIYLRASKKSTGDSFVYIYSSNLASETLIKLKADVEEEGHLLLDSTHILGGLSGRPKEDNVTLSLIEEGKRLKVQYKTSRFHVGVPEGADTLYAMLQKIPFDAKPSFKVKGSDLSEFCRRGMFCIPKDDSGHSGQIMGGMYITDSDGGYAAHATDGAIAARIQVNAEKGIKGVNMGRFMLPLKSLPAVNRLLGRRREEQIDIVEGPKGQYGVSKMFFRTGDVIFGSQLLIGSLENLKGIIAEAKPKHQFEIDRAELKSALDRVASFADGKSRMMRLEIKEKTMTLKMATSGSLSEIDDFVDIVHKDKFDGSLKLALNMDYLINIAGGSTGDKLGMGVTGPVNAIVLTDDSDERVNSKYVLMPVKV